jgi:hypothetical protein
MRAQQEPPGEVVENRSSDIRTNNGGILKECLGEYVAINPEPQCLALTEASRSSLLSKSVRSSASSSPRSICGTSFTNAGLCVTVSITAHMSRPGTFSITYRTSELSLENRVMASARLVRLAAESRHSLTDSDVCFVPNTGSHAVR